MMKRSVFIFLIICSFLVDALVGIAGPDNGNKNISDRVSPENKGTPPCRAKTDNRLRFAVHVTGMGKLDPHFSAGSQDRTVADMVFNGLLRYIPGNAPAIEPDLAKAMPKLSTRDGKQIWTVALRRGVMFHPGPDTPSYELTADDVVFSFSKAANHRQSAYAGDYGGMAIKKIGPYTVEFILDRPISSILFFPKITNYNGGFIVSRKAIEKTGYQAFLKHPVGTGPFLFKTHDPGISLSLDAHQAYFRGKPALDGVDLYFVPDTKKRKAGLLSGQYDVIVGSGQKGFADELLQNQGIEINPHGPGEVTTIYLNTGIPPFDDIRVRKAVAHAIDRREFLKVYDTSCSGPVFSPVPADFLPGGLTHNEVQTYGITYEHNPDKARTLLAAAGYPNGFKLELVGSEKRIYRNFYGILKKQLARVGIDCTIDILTHADMHKTIRKNPKPIVIYTAWRPNADVFLTRFFHSDAILVTGAKPDTNFSNYTSIDTLIRSARVELKPEKQISLWQHAQIKILHDAAAYPVMYAIMNTPRRSCVDYGHTLKASMALYPQFTEKTKFIHK